MMQSTLPDTQELHLRVHNVKTYSDYFFFEEVLGERWLTLLLVHRR